jgi:hypothetical protein
VAAASRVNRKPSQYLDQSFRLFTCSKKLHGKTALIVTIECRSKRVLNKHHLVFVWLVLYETIVSLHLIAKRIYSSTWCCRSSFLASFGRTVSMHGSNELDQVQLQSKTLVETDTVLTLNVIQECS